MDKQLPMYVVFKGDNGMYLQASSDGYLQFSSANALDERCTYIIEYTNDSDGTIHIKSPWNNCYWELISSPENWICAAQRGTATSKNRRTMFRPVKIREGTYALQNLNNGGCYCRRYTASKRSGLSAGFRSSLNREAQLTVEEAVLSRRIFDVEYRTQEANIHDRKVITLTSTEAVNRTSKNDKVKLSLKYTVAKERKWDSSVTMKFGVRTTFEAGIPEVASTKIEIESEFSKSYTWGESIQITEENSTEYEVDVSPGTKGIVRVVTTQATCEVRFSYSQEDVLTTGEKVIKRFNDGIYRGVNSYDVSIQHTEEKI